MTTSVRPPAPTPSLARSSSVMALGTIASRSTGFLRTAIIVAALGTGALGDAYNVPNAAPNIVYDLLLGGVLTSVIVPLLVAAVREDADHGEAYAQRLLTIVAVVLGALTVLAVVAAPLVIDVYGGSFHGAKRAVAITFARYFLPQIFFYGVGATVGAILNVRGRFAAPMWAPVLNNLVVIGTGLAFLAVVHGNPDPETLTAGQRTLLGAGTTVGVVVQTAALWPSLRASGFRWRPRFDWRDSRLGSAARLGGWVFGYVAVNQIGLLIITNLAGAAGNKANGVGYTPYINAFQIFQLPYAIAAVSVITALLPRMSAHAVEGRLGALRSDLSASLRTTAVAVVPAMFGLIALAPQIATIAFGHRNSSDADARYIGYVLIAFAIGLVPFSAFQLHLRAFYALRDTRTPALINLVSTAVNIAVDVAAYLVLPAHWKVVGLALGYAVSYWAAVALTSIALSRRLDGLDGWRVIRTHVRLAVGSLFAGALAYGLARWVGALVGRGFAGSVLAVVVGGGLGGVLLIAAISRMRVSEAGAIVRTLRGRFSS